MIIYAACTAPINPPSASPVLSIEEVWKALLIKTKRPQDFVAEIVDCEVLEETEKGVTRSVTFKPGVGPPGGKLIEIITYGEPYKVEFKWEKGNTRILNYVSHGEGETDLYLTFYFEWDNPNLEEGSTAVEEQRKFRQNLAKTAVTDSVGHMRGLAVKGLL